MLVHAYNSIIMESEGQLYVSWSLNYIVQLCLKKNDIKINSKSEEIPFQSRMCS